MSTEQQTTAIMPFTETDLQSAGSVFTTSTNMLSKYTAKQSVLIERAVKAGDKLPKELDDDLMNWQVSAKKAVKFMNETRAVYTEKAHAFIKAFTSIENTLSKDLYEPIQRVRDKSAKIYAEEAAAARAKELADLAAKQKRIDDIAALEGQLRNGYALHLSTVKQTLLQAYSSSTIEQIGALETELITFLNVSLSNEAWNAITLVGEQELIEEVRTQAKFDACSIHFTTEVSKYAEYLISLIPTRVSELKAGLAKSKAAEELAEKQKKEAEEAKLVAQKKAEAEATKAKQAANVTVMVAQANREVEAPKSIESYTVSVQSVDGWRAIVDYYLSNSDVNADELGKVKLDQMRTFAEKQAKATGEMVEHADIAYEPKYKAVARATKKKAA